MPEQQNPLVQIMDEMEKNQAENPSDFSPHSELGISDEHYTEYIKEVIGTLLSSLPMESGGVIIGEEELAYLVALGTYVGVLYGRKEKSE